MSRFLCYAFLLLGLLVGCGKKEAYRTVSTLDPNYIAAQELKLKVRELADQLLAGLPNDSLSGYVALPVSFVDQDNFRQSSALGRYLTETLIFEFNQRGFPVREYRTDGTITMDENMGESTLARKGKVAAAKGRNNALLIGTYHQDPDAVFVNARLVRASDGIVMRTAQIMLTPNPVLSRMGITVAPGFAAMPELKSGTLRFKQAASRNASAPRTGIIASACP